VYHRFPDLPALLAALWLRTVQRFREGFLAALSGDPPQQAAVDAARHVVEWSRQNPGAARVLLAGAREFAESEWAEQAPEEAGAANGEVERAVGSLARRLASTRKAELSRIVLALVDVPYAVVRRHLTRGAAIPARESEVVADAVHDLLGFG
jgi:AcrR family transcriptional regulator